MTITRAAVHHRPKSNMAYAADAETVHVRLRTERDDVEACRLLHGDKFDWPESKTLTAMEKVHADADHDYWQVAVQPENRRLCYAFQLQDEDEALWRTEWGFEENATAELPTMGETRPMHYYEYPFLNAADVIDPPEWVSDAVFYQIFPERFANGNPENDPDETADWGDAPTLDNHFGGDLQGVIDHLDHLVDLGVTAIYLTPIFAGETNHKYDTTDYERIDPQFGDEETLSRLVDAAHDRDMRVVLDAVFNHCGRQFAPFQDVVENGADSEYADWFHVHEFPVEFEPRPTFDAFGFEGHMPKLNTENPEVRDYLLDVATHWIEATGADGWRLDVADEVSHAFWREFRSEVKAVNEEAYVLGEVWHDSAPWLQGDQFDATMNYPFTYAVDGFLTEAAMDGTEFADRVGRFRFRYPEQVNQVLFNMLGSHDTARLLHRCDGDKTQLRLAVLLLLTAPGTPCIYYGDEVGMTGGEDPDCRRTMVWDEAEQDRELFAFFREVVALRNDRRALRRGRISFEREQCEGDVVVYQMSTGEPDESVAVAVNRGHQSFTVELPAELPPDAEVVFETGASELRRRDDRTFELPARAGVVWE